MVEHISDVITQWLKYEILIRSKNQPPPFLAYKLALESTMKEYCNKNKKICHFQKKYVDIVYFVCFFIVDPANGANDIKEM